MENKKKSRTGLWVAVILLALLLVFSAMINFGFIALSLIGQSVASSMGPEKRQPSLNEEWVEGKGDIKVVRLELNSVIMRNVAGGGLLGGGVNMVEQLQRKIKAATDDRSVRAIILDVNSPGGAITPTDEIYQALLDFKKSGKDREIVTFVRDMAVSGSYWVAVAGDWIIAEPTSIIGSIGVVLQSYNWSELSQNIGVTDTTIKSGENKDLLNPFNKTPPEQKAILQEVIDSNFDHFKQVVMDRRNIDETKMDSIADGRIVTSDSALDSDLIDQIGYWDDSIAYTKDLLGVENFRLIRYKQPRGFFEMFASASVRELQNLLKVRSPRLMSIWE